MSATVVGAVVVAVLGMGLVGFGLSQASSTRRQRVADALDLTLSQETKPTAALALALERSVKWAESRTEGTPFRERMLVKLERARVTLRPEEFLLIWAGAVVGPAVVGLVFGGLLWGAVLAVIGALVPPAVLSRRTTTWTRDFEAQLPDVLDLLASSMEAGHSLLTALQLVGEDAAEPMGSEVNRVLSETEVGRPLLEALDAMSRRIDVQDLAWTVEGIRIQSEVGGRLSEMLRTLAGFMRAREEVRRELRALTAEGKLSAYVLGGLPILMLLFMSFAAREYIKPLFTQTAGQIMLGFAAVLMIGSGLAMRKIVDVEV
ncbi:MAG: Bacterial type secretion system protein domain protein [Frankiales bacterium]|nr:Bacterial type secretion system protein domain protein [Frankiales bacterium]